MTPTPIAIHSHMRMLAAASTPRELVSAEIAKMIVAGPVTSTSKENGNSPDHANAVIASSARVHNESLRRAFGQCGALSRSGGH